MLADGSGTLVAGYAYDPYGKTVASGNPGGNAFAYTGREEDGMGLYYYRARYYHPGLGRFVSEDPIGLAGGDNLYSYVGGNPVSYRDPTGHELPSQKPPTNPKPISGPYDAPPKPVDKVVDWFADQAIKRCIGIGGIITKSPFAAFISGMTYSEGLGGCDSAGNCSDQYHK